MYITKTNIQTLVEEAIKELHAIQPARRDRDRPKPAPEEKSRPDTYIGRGDTNTGGPKLDDDPARHRPSGNRPGKFAGYEESIEESEETEDNVLTNNDIEDFNLLARDSLAAIEEAGLIEQVRDMLPIQMRNVIDQKVSEFKSDLIEFIETKMIDLVITREQEL